MQEAAALTLKGPGTFCCVARTPLYPQCNVAIRPHEGSTSKEALCASVYDPREEEEEEGGGEEAVGWAAGCRRGNALSQWLLHRTAGWRQGGEIGGRIPYQEQVIVYVGLHGSEDEVYMGCTIYAASPQGLQSDQTPGRDRYYMLPPHHRHPHDGPCKQRIAADGARSRSMTEPQQEQAEETGTLATHDPDPAKEEDTHGHFRQ
ncbi:hypothetical protein CRUP_034398, partial [Coryphaenoides rupestris]